MSRRSSVESLFDVVLRSAPLGVLLATPALALAQALSGFGDTVPLQALIARAVEQHPSLDAARSAIAAAEQDQAAARWQRFPTLSVQTDNPVTGKPQASVALNQPLWTAGKVTAQIAQSDQTHAAAQAKLQEVRYEQALKVVDGWRAANAAEERMKIHQRVLERLAEFDATMRNRVSANVSPKVELDLLQARIEQARADMLQAQADRQIALNKLGQLIGEPVSGSVSPAAELSDYSQELKHDLQGPLPRTLAEQIAKSHPALQRQQAEAMALRESSRVREADQWPQVFARLAHVNTPGVTQNETRVSLNVQFSPGAGLSAASAAKGAAARAEGAEHAAAATLRDLIDQASTEWTELQAHRLRLRGFAMGAAHGRSVLDSYERQFVAGKRSWLDVLNALRDLQQAELAQAEARVAAAGLHERLRIRLGTLSWQQARATASAGAAAGAQR